MNNDGWAWRERQPTFEVTERMRLALEPAVSLDLTGFTASVLMYDANGAPFYETERVQVEPGTVWTVRFTDEALRLTCD